MMVAVEAVVVMDTASMYIWRVFFFVFFLQEGRGGGQPRSGGILVLFLAFIGMYIGGFEEQSVL